MAVVDPVRREMHTRCHQPDSRPNAFQLLVGGCATAFLLCAALVGCSGPPDPAQSADETGEDDIQACRMSEQSGSCIEMFGSSLCPKYCFKESAPAGIVGAHQPRVEKSGRRPRREERPLELVVAISHEGFRLGAEGEILEPLEGCPADGPTICLADDSVDVESKVEQMRRAYRDGDQQRGDRLLETIVDAYDWRRLYNRATALHDEHPETTSFKLSSRPDLPYELYVRVMDVLRYRLEKPQYADREAFRSASTQKKEGERGVARPAVMFPDPVLTIAK